MLLEKPYFMENEEWYYHDKKKNRYFLTDNAPEKAKKSYEEHYAQLDMPDPDFLAQAIKDAELLYRNDLRKEGKSPEEIEKIINEWKYRITH